ncbi:ATP-binding sensor histidine kinase [Cytobacillus purgationiresistens]|nr:ATP-binding sensor histidine kinase [Cytobacillus purgationiresistens]
MSPIMNLPGFRVLGIETENASIQFYKAYSIETGKQVLIKAGKSKEPSIQDNTSSIHEFHMSSQLKSDDILQPIKMVQHLNKYYFVYEYFSGITLESFLNNHQLLNIGDGLRLAKNLATALSSLHQQQIIHKNINPENILLSKSTYDVKITGFNHSTLLLRENYSASIRPNEIDGQLNYISPEQTGRMNRSIDYRTDLYSLGVTLYRVFTGILPFLYNDPVQLVHAHLAKTPMKPVEMRKDLPNQISEVIMKLLEKPPESRYKSAWGVREDLGSCLSQYYALNEIKAFPLGERDQWNIFETARRIYGREGEISTIQAVFSKVSSGDLGIVFIPGQAGIGKTALVNEIHKPLIKEKGYFISGKFDQLQRQIPFAPIISAFQSLIRQIMTESPEQIARWKQKLEEELSVHNDVIVSIIPELKWLIGDEQINIQEGSSVDTQRRFLFIFQKFIQVFAAKEHPLVLFLDDLQWADIASLEMLEYLLTQANSQYLMVIGAYRHNEINDQHPLKKTIKTLREEDVPFVEIPLTNLSKATIYDWLGDSLLDSGKQTEELSFFMHRITQGNPFYTKQLLQSFYEDGHIVLLPEERRWAVQYNTIIESPINEDIINFIVGRIRLLPQETQNVLKLASCIGNLFDLKTLSIISQKPIKETANHLWAALEAGLILPNDGWYKWVYPDEEAGLLENRPPAYIFLHDRVQQAVYSTMTEEEQELAHVMIGRLLVKFSNQVENQLFTIVSHFNRSKQHLSSEETFKLTKWNILAGEKARASAAFIEALKYFKTASDLMGPRWEEQYDLTLRLMYRLGECQYVTGQFAEAEKTFDTILQNSRSQADKLDIYTMKMTLYTHMHRVEEAVQSGIRGLELYGMKFPKQTTKLDVAREFILVKQALLRKGKNGIENLPELVDKDKKNILNTMISMNASTYHIDQNLATLLMLRALRFTLKHGITDISALVMNNYSLILSAGFSDFKGSHEFGKLALSLSEKFGHIGIKGRVQFVYGSFVNHWAGPISSTLEYLEKSQRYCLDAGNIHLAGANSSFIVITLLMKGTQIEQALDGLRNQIQFVNQIQYQISRGFLDEVQQWLEFLIGIRPSHSWEMKPVMNDDSAKIIHYTIRLQMSFIFNKSDYAQEILESLAPMINKRLTLVIVPEYYFYHSLWLARFYEETEEAIEKRRIYQTLKRFIKKLKKWADLSPVNYQHKYLLLKAEMLRLTNKKPNEKEILTLYSDSIRFAEENGFIQDAAICNECAGRYFAHLGFSRLSHSFLMEAYHAYQKWGAKAKTEQMLQADENLSMRTISAFGDSSFFDTHAALEATQSITKEIILDKLSDRLMQITMEYGGADRGILLFKKGSEFILSEHKSVDEYEAGLLKYKPIVGSGLISDKIVHFVDTSREAVVLDNAAAIGMFTDDPYVAERKTKSLLCLPILNKGKVNGILYLENNKATHAFTEEKIQFLTFLSTQAAISIENAYLYEQMEHTVAKRTAELHEANLNLEKLNQRLEGAEHSRKHFLENISHDLRAPVSSVNGYLEAVLDGLAVNDAEKTRYLIKAHERLQDLQILIHDLFELSQLESGQLNFTSDYISLDQFINHIYHKYDDEIEQHGLSFKLVNQLQAQDIQLFMIELDLERIEQVFTNLVANALNHTQHGEISITFGKASNSEQVIIQIRDTGNGIRPSELPYIFDRNFTKQGSYAKKKGHGLGLSICREIIAYHKGEIWVESEEGVGTTFFITLPLFQYAEEV